MARVAGPLSGLRALDIGCGEGDKTRALAAMGAEAVGLEPRAEAVAAARAKGGGEFVVGGIGDAPDIGRFDLTVFTLSLHHTPDPAAAIAFARGLLRPGGRLAVLEPEAHDPSWPLVRLIDDEEPVYRAAEAALADAEAAGTLVREAGLHYAERERVTTAADYVAEMTVLDPSRAPSREEMAGIEAAFEQVAERDAEGAFVTNWLRLDLFRAA